MSNGSKSGSKPSASHGASDAGSSGSISSSFLGLKAELERSKASLASSSSSSKRKSASSSTTVKADVKQKKLSSAFLDTSSTKVSKRSSDADEDTKRKKRTPSTPREPSTSQLDKIRNNLERKARIYDQLQSGKYGGFTTAELKEGSIDWERKRAEPRPPSRSPSPPEAGVDEPEIDYEDEFGRTRRGKLSDVPREFLHAKYGGDLEEEQEEEDNAVYGPSTSFPVYDPSLHRREKEERNRFGSGFEKRHRGAAFYKFSNEEGERRAQMHQLAELRRETLERRRDGRGDVT